MTIYKKKIGLFLGAQSSGGGTFQYCQAMLHAVSYLSQKEFEVVILYTNDEWNAKLDEFALTAKKVKNNFWGRSIGKLLRISRLSTWLERVIVPYFHPIGREIIRQNCNLWIFPSAEQWSYQIPVPALVTIYDLMHRYEKRFSEVSANGIFEWREKHYKRICKYSLGIFVDSNVGKQQVIESYNCEPSKIHILPYVPCKYYYVNEELDGFNDRYRDLGKFIFYPAQFWEHKNHKKLVEAVHILKRKHPDLLVVFVGSKKNGYQSTYEMIIKLNLSENFRFLGYVTDEEMPQLYRRARGMIMPTFLGPTNIPPLEANALGCPVAVSNIYGSQEQLGDATIYFNPNSVLDISKAIEIIWTNDELCEKLRINGLKKSNSWNQSHFEKKTEEIIEKILDAC